MTIDRTKEPQLKAIEEIHMPLPLQTTLANNIPVHIFDLGTEELVRIELIVKGGAKYHQNPLVASFTNQLMNEGTKQKDSETIAEAFDYFGARLDASTSNDHCAFVLTSMNKNLTDTLALMKEVLLEPAFLQSEYDTLVTNRRQIFNVNMQKVGSIAKNRFPVYLFGEGHPYGNNIRDEHFETLTKADLEGFYEEMFVAERMEIVVAGKVPNELKSLLDEAFGDAFAKNRTTQEPNLEIFASAGQYAIAHEGAVQNAFRWGMHTIHKTHPEFPALRITNALFGGFFGSRLMKNIREDKGYTYGIGSSVLSYAEASFFVISTEVGAEVSDAARKEIYLELDRMHNELVSDEDLALLKNFLQGSLLRGFDGPFAAAARFKDVHFYGLDYGYFKHYLEVLQNMTPEYMQQIAQKHLRKEAMVELIVGKV